MSHHPGSSERDDDNTGNYRNSHHNRNSDDIQRIAPPENVRTKTPTFSGIISYSEMTIPQAQRILNVKLALCGIPVKKMLEEKPVLLGPVLISKAKEQVYGNLVRYLETEGYPGAAAPDFNVANINDVVLFTIYPLLYSFNFHQAQNRPLDREKKIVLTNSATTDEHEFVMLEQISAGEHRLMVIVQAKMGWLGEAQKLCFLYMKDMRENNGGGIVYGFITSGDGWRMVSYDGAFVITEEMRPIFDTMGKDKRRWMKDYSLIVDCLNVALSDAPREETFVPVF
ncbi:hypothetical protein HOY82DRAFT_538055 [Tuber indicum]|nr:hypothetical protein HOY82DRAFT_538055 [Tuber indicum]